jgi:hypothetical protein
MFELASRLGQPLSVIMDMTADEFEHWFVYYRIKQEMVDGRKR